MREHFSNIAGAPVSHLRENAIIAAFESMLGEIAPNAGQNKGTARASGARARGRGALILALGIGIALALVPASLKVGDVASTASSRQAANAATD